MSSFDRTHESFDELEEGECRMTMTISSHYDVYIALVVSIGIGFVDGFQLNHYLQRRELARRSTSCSSLEMQNVNDLNPTIGHPALLEAIDNFPRDILQDTTINNPTTIDTRRIFHGRGGLYEGANHLTLDYYPPVFLLTSFEELCNEELSAYGAALEKMWGSMMNSDYANVARHNDEETSPSIIEETSLTWVYQCRADKGNSTTRLMTGHIPEPHLVSENNGRNKFFVHLLRGQNHGLFLDMSAGRQWLQEKCTDDEINSVLNLFAYTCAFSVAALNGGAESVVNVDMSRGALKTGQRNHELNGVIGSGNKGTAKFLSHDLFKSWGKIKRLGPYDIVVADPPSYQKGSFVASKDYIKVIRRLPSLLRPNGYALLCLNAPELNTQFLLDQVNEGVPNSELCFVERLQNPPEFASAFPEKALKVLVFQYRPTTDMQDDDR